MPHVTQVQHRKRFGRLAWWAECQTCEWNQAWHERQDAKQAATAHRNQAD